MPQHDACMNFALYENARELHEYTREQKKEGSGFDGDLDNFQEPKLSSLSKLNANEIFQLDKILDNVPGGDELVRIRRLPVISSLQANGGERGFPDPPQALYGRTVQGRASVREYAHVEVGLGDLDGPVVTAPRQESSRIGDKGKEGGQRMKQIEEEGNSQHVLGDNARFRLRSWPCPATRNKKDARNTQACAIQFIQLFSPRGTMDRFGRSHEVFSAARR
ncbi:hypothetical protein EI94DRAFT_1913222 [Lactarius quietus]|nr:hypothetical protein EI94DRAFT_1913222 [Lactarius quietus]